MPEFDLHAARLETPSVLVYWHCDSWWSIEDGPVCPMEHDTPIYDDRPRNGRVRRVWMCDKGEGEIAYLSRRAFLEHDEESCYAE